LAVQREVQLTAAMDLGQTSDETLLRQSAGGDEKAFLTLYRRRQAGIYRFALHMSGSASIAEEVTQEVFLAVIRDGKRFDESRGTAAAFLFGVARNHVLKLLQRSRAYIGLDAESAAEPPASVDVLSDLTRAEAVENVRQAVLELPAVYREAVVMCDLQEMSYADAAEALRVPIGTVRSRVARGRAILAQKLSRQGNEGFSVLRCFA
jgi:RNA polymerase sigma-70 factor (ECF subfamily)